MASGLGVEKSFLLHSPNVIKIEVTKRSSVRRNYLSYMRERTGKAARLTGVKFDNDSVNVIDDKEPVEEVKAEEAEAPSEKVES